MPIPIQTIKYKTHIKTVIVEGLSEVFSNHPDSILRKTHVGIDFPLEEASYPSIVVRFYERDIHNAGVGHKESVETEEGSGRWVNIEHFLYNGDIEFAVYALSSLDRDLVSDSLVQTLTMSKTEPYTRQLWDRVYSTGGADETNHMMNLNTDKIQGFGETQQIAPWLPEDTMVYQVSYRIGIFGEFNSRIPAAVNYGLVERIETYPYIGSIGEPVPEPGWSGPDDIQGTPDDEPDSTPWEPV